jgi:hypothetical protein
MDYQNVTLSIPKDTLKKARLIAVQQQKSLSGLLTDYIQQIVESDMAYRQAYQRQKMILEQGLNLDYHASGTFNRESLHERD